MLQFNKYILKFSSGNFEKEGDLLSGKCIDCEFCFPHEDYGFVCASANYGKNISDSLEEIKDCYSEGLDAFIERSEREEISFDANTRLDQLKIDGRKQIELIDQEGKTIQIKTSKAKKFFGDVSIQCLKFENCYVVNAVFDKEIFNGGSYLVIR